MSPSQKIIRTYVIITLLSTLATSLIWGLDTLFLLDAGLSISQIFIVNACFMVGQVLFEVPTGIVADTKGRKLSFLLGCITLALVTAANYVFWQVQAPMVFWMITTTLLGLGFTFFSGATEAWLVDALHATKHSGTLDKVFAKGQVANGIAMLTGSVGGGIIAQSTNLGVPYIIRAALLVITFIYAFRRMTDLGFEPELSVSTRKQIRTIWRNSLKHGIGNLPVRWLMLSSIFGFASSYFAFYALQPYLLELYKNPNAYSIAGLAAALIAATRILGALLASKLSRLFARRTTFMMSAMIVSALCLFGFAATDSFIVALFLIALWGFCFTAANPVYRTYLNGLIPSKQRATILSFDSMLGSTGAAAIQPALGSIAQGYGYATAYVVSGAVQLISVPFFLLARAQHTPSDKFDHKK